MTRLAKILVGAAFVSVLVYVYYTEVKPVVIFGLREDYARPIPFQAVPEGLDSLSAESCGTCHREIYEEWKSSIHAHAFEDPFFQAYWRRDDNIWVCLNCHTPLENQQPTLIREIPRGRVERAVQVPNPGFDAGLQREAVTCAVCHVRDGEILGPYDDSAAPHPTRFDPAFRTTQICYRCHNVVSGPAQFYNVGPCGTYAEYEGGYFMQERHLICQSCHMPEIERPVAEGGPVRRGRQHLWRGGHDPEMVRRALAIDVALDPPEPRAGEEVRFTLTLVNAGAGHKIPTGDPDRFFTVDFLVRDRAGRVLSEQRDTMGRWIMWQPVILEVLDNRLLPLASRDYTFDYEIPAEADGLSVTARVQYHILTDDQHAMLREDFGLTGDDPYRFVVYERTFPLSRGVTEARRRPSAAEAMACAGAGDPGSETRPHHRFPRS